MARVAARAADWEAALAAMVAVREAAVAVTAATAALPEEALAA